MSVGGYTYDRASSQYMSRICLKKITKIDNSFIQKMPKLFEPCEIIANHAKTYSRDWVIWSNALNSAPLKRNLSISSFFAVKSANLIGRLS